MSYAEVLAELSLLRRFGVRPALEPTRTALVRLGNPQNRLRIVHVAGTNGKGSTAAMIDAILRQAGARTGLYTSPHLSRFTERIRVAGVEIAREDVVRLVRSVRTVAPGLTFFETATCAALLHFAEAEVDVAILETGLGGRLDATNVVDPIVTVITRIGLDHTDVLGDTLAQVAREKAGILKPGRPALGMADGPEREVLMCAARETGVRLRLAPADFAPWRGEVGLAGAHQRENATLAAEVARQLDVSEETIALGLKTVQWPGRLERVGRFLLDCAHNPQAAVALAETVGEVDALVFGCLEDKDAATMLRALPRAGEVWLVRPRAPRAREPADLVGLRPGARVATVADALGSAAGKPVLVTGSIYLVGEVREILLGEEPDPLPVGDPSPRV